MMTIVEAPRSLARMFIDACGLAQMGHEMRTEVIVPTTPAVPAPRLFLFFCGFNILEATQPSGDARPRIERARPRIAATPFNRWASWPTTEEVLAEDAEAQGT